MENIQFLLDFAQGGNLNQTIKDLEKLNSLYKDNVELQKQYGNASKEAIAKSVNEYNALNKSISETQKKLQGSSDAKEVISLTAEISKLQKQYEGLIKDIDKLNQKKKESKQISDAELQQQIRSQQKLNERKKAIRELIKDETALQIAERKQVKSLQELNEQTNALVRVRSKLDLTTKEGKKQFDELTAKIKSNTDAQKKFDEQIGRSQRNVGNYQSAFRGLGSTIATVTGVTIGLSSIGSFARDSVDAFKEFDAQLKETSAITGLAGADLDLFKNKALEVGANSRTSASEYLNAIKTIASAKPELLSNAEGLQLVADKAMLLAEASGMDLPTATASLTDAMNQFGASADEAGKFVDTLAAGAKFGSAEVPEITEALLKMGLVAKSSNINLQESTAVIEALAERGLKGAEAGTQLRNVLLKLSTVKALPPKATAELRAAGINMDVLSDKSLSLNDRLKELSKIAQNDTAIVRVFGTENVVAAKAILNNTDRIAELTKQVDENGVALEQATVNNKSAAAQSEVLNNRLETVSITLGEKLLPLFNAFKTALITIAEFVTGLIDKLGSLGESIGQFSSNYKDALDLMNNQSETVQKLINSFDNLEKNHTKVAAAIVKNSKDVETTADVFEALNNSYKILDKSTGTVQRSYKKLETAFNSGKIKLEDYLKGIQYLTTVQGKLNEVIESTPKAAEASAEELEAISAKEAADAQKALDKAYEDQLKDIERQKVLEETAVERSVNNEQERADKKLYIEQSYLEKKLVLDIAYAKDSEKTELELVQKKNQIYDKDAENKRKSLQKQIDIQNELDEIEFQRIKDAEDKAVVAEMRALERKLEELKKAGLLNKELEEALTKQTEEKISEIRAEYRKKRTNDELKAIDDYYKELELNALESNMTQEELDKELQQNELDRLQELIDKTEEAGEDATDLRIQLANKKRAIADKEAEEDKERLRENIEMLKEGLDLYMDAYNEALDKRIERTQDEIEKQKENISVQESLAERGLENTLAFEKQALAQKEKQLLEQQKKQQRLKEIETFFNLLAAYSEKDPNTAAVKAFAQLQISKAIAAKLEDGGVIADEVAKQNGGILKGASHKRGGILIEAEGSEGIFSKKEMRNLGKDNFYAIKEALKNPVSNNVFRKHSDDVMSLAIKKDYNTIDLDPLKREMREVKEAIMNKPVPSMNIDKYGNLITTHTAPTLIKRIIHKNNRKSFNH